VVVAEELYSARPEGLAENRHALEPWHLRKEESIEPTAVQIEERDMESRIQGFRFLNFIDRCLYF